MVAALWVRDGYNRRNALDGHKQWEARDYALGLMGDLGDLAKLMQAYHNYRTKPDVVSGLAHELGDCLWSLIVIADAFGIDLEQAFIVTMDEIIARDNLSTQ